MVPFCMERMTKIPVDGGEKLSQKSKHRIPKNRKKTNTEIIPLDHPTASDCDQILNLTGLLHSHYIFQVQKFLF